MLTISLNDIIETVKVKIGDDIFTVRRMGGGEELNLSQLMSHSSKLIDEASKLQTTFIELSASDEKKIPPKKLKTMTTRLNDITTELNTLQEKQLSAYIGLFDDGGDGSKSRNLLEKSTLPKIKELIAQIFEQAELEKLKTTEADDGTEA